MNRINWKVRIKNPVFWVQAAIAVILPILTYFGLTWEDMTSWAAIGNLLLQAVRRGKAGGDPAQLEALCAAFSVQPSILRLLDL